MTDTDRRFARPLPGRKVRDPITLQPLDEAGDQVVWSTYWDRRLMDGDISTGTVEEDAAAAKAAEAKAKADAKAQREEA